MSGFKNKRLNQVCEQRFYNKILFALITGCKLLVQDCHSLIPNNEEKIRTYLLENYLENEQMLDALGLSKISIRFLPEVVENYDASTHTYCGRTDIRIVSKNWFNNSQDYYIVECKRLDGTHNLHQKYVDEGVCRFTGVSPKYSSYHNKNIMLGFIIKNIKPIQEVIDIDAIHKVKLSGTIIKNITCIQNEDDYCLCESIYTNNLLLNHIFYNISGAVS